MKSVALEVCGRSVFMDDCDCIEYLTAGDDNNDYNDETTNHLHSHALLCISEARTSIPCKPTDAANSLRAFTCVRAASVVSLALSLF